MVENKSIKGGVVWVAMANYFQLLISFTVLVFLSRSLTEEDFGVVALFTLISTFCNIFIDSGISSAVIQKRNLSTKDKQTFFTVSFIFATIFSVVLLFFNDALELILNSSHIGDIIPLIVINLYIIAVTSVPFGILKREIKFKIIALGEISGVLLGAMSAIFVAYQGYGFWAVIIQTQVYLVIKALLYSYKSKFIASKFVLAPNTLAFLKSYSSYIVMFSSFNFWARNADNVLVSRYSGEAILGLYSQAYRLMTLPMQLITAVANAVIHPIFSKSIREGNKISNKYLELLSYIFLLSIPCFMVLFFYSETLIKIIWGERWISSAVYLNILAILVLFQPALATSGDVFKSTGNSKLLFKVGVINTSIIVLSMGIGIRWGVKGMCFGYVLSYAFFVTPITIFTIFKQIGLPVNINRCLIRIIPISILLIVSLLAIRNLGVSPLIQVLASVIITLLFFLGWYMMYRKEIFND